MKTIKLEAEKMKTKESAHHYLKEVLNFSSFYGNNLDALWDELTSLAKPFIIEVSETKALEKNLGKYGKHMIEIFKEASKENKNIKLILNE